jgi:hypothetical protein
MWIVPVRATALWTKSASTARPSAAPDSTWMVYVILPAKLTASSVKTAKRATRLPLPRATATAMGIPIRLSVKLAPPSVKPGTTSAVTASTNCVCACPATPRVR